MTLEFIVVLLMGLVGLIWVIVLGIFSDDHHTHDNRQGSPSPEHRDGARPHEGSPQQSKVTA
jgi:hypothetical protein